MSSTDELKSYNNRLQALRTERSAWMDYWGELADNVLFSRGKALTKLRGQPTRNTKQFNNTPRIASRIQQSGMMAGITSPARPWFKITTSDPGLNERRAVKDWLHRVQSMMNEVFSHSNVYNCLNTIYGDLGTFGVGAMGVYENYSSVIRAFNYPIGSYMLSQGPDYEIDTFYYEGVKTVAQLVKEFGLDNVSESTRRAWERGNSELLVEYVHVVEPNDNREMMSPLASDMRYRSRYYEIGAQSKKAEKMLRKSGFDSFPIMAPRWDVSPDAAYGDDCPGMTCLGDCKALQLGEKRKYQALDKLANPPLQGSPEVIAKIKNGQLNPGDMIAVGQNQAELKSIYSNFQPRLDYVQAIQKEVEQRINTSYFVDLFLMMARSDRREVTAREIAEKHEEKLLMLGPVLERLHTELLDKLIDRTFDIMQRNGMMPVPPRELANMNLNIEYVSVMAQAQRMVGISAIERTIGFVANISQIWPNARHKIDPMQAVDDYAQSVGTNPRIIRPDDEANEIVAAEQQAAAQQRQMAQQAEAAKTMKDASAATVTDENALGLMLRNAGLQ